MGIAENGQAAWHAWDIWGSEMDPRGLYYGFYSNVTEKIPDKEPHQSILGKPWQDSGS